MAAEYKKPNLPVRVMNASIGVVIRLGLSPQGGQLLTVRGRKSGKDMSTPVNPMAFEGVEKRPAAISGLNRCRDLQQARIATNARQAAHDPGRHVEAG